MVTGLDVTDCCMVAWEFFLLSTVKIPSNSVVVCSLKYLGPP